MRSTTGVDVEEVLDPLETIERRGFGRYDVFCDWIDLMLSALQSLVLDEVLLGNGPAVWIDTHGHGTTRPLARLEPSMRVLKRNGIARAFTPWQHLTLLRVTFIVRSRRCCCYHPPRGSSSHR